jgi:hypothetical protein
MLTASQISQLMKEKSPVFIVAAPRSGSTLLYKLLQYHYRFTPQKCHSKSEIAPYETAAFRKPYHLPKYTPAFKYMLENRELHMQFLQDGREILNSKTLFDLNLIISLHQKILTGEPEKYQLLGRVTILRKLLWNLTGLKNFVRLFFYYSNLARGEERIVEKTPLHIFNLLEIRATFPQAKLIAIVRHPLDVYSSYKMRLKKELRQKQEKESRQEKVPGSVMESHS